MAIDNALSQSPADFEELLKLLQEYGCEVSKRGKSYRLKLSGWEKAARMDSLGEGYGLEDLRAVLLGKKAHTPRKKTVTQAEPPKVNLLVDIQAKLQAGKGAGYARWAKVFNLKQMAQTMNYLSENNLLEYAVLEEKAAAATAHHNDLSAQIKAAEKRMAEIAVLCTHIVNYAKTREVYVAYRKAGYSKKFREEHEEEILLHQAAKNAFDGLDIDYILVYKLSRFGRNAADILNSLELVQSYGVNLICIEEGIDSSQTSGKLLISVLTAVAEIERENIIEQTMNGRREKARQGGWNGGFAPYGYTLEDNKLMIEETEAVAIRKIFELYTSSEIGLGGIANQLNLQGIRKIPRQMLKKTDIEPMVIEAIREIVRNEEYAQAINGLAFRLTRKQWIKNWRAIRQS